MNPGLNINSDDVKKLAKVLHYTIDEFGICGDTLQGIGDQALSLFQDPAASLLRSALADFLNVWQQAGAEEARILGLLAQTGIDFSYTEEEIAGYFDNTGDGSLNLGK